jgi:hypothetical protein
MKWVSFQPELEGEEQGLFLDAARVLARRGPGEVTERRNQLLRAIGRAPSMKDLRLYLAQSFLLDLLGQSWRVRVRDGRVSVQVPATKGETPEQTKERIRQAHLIDRDLQLRQPPVQAFVHEMEQRRLTRMGWHSIFSLMRDGRELASALERAQAGNSGDPLAAAISPYLQFVEPDQICEHTGLRLSDVWRYFRLTWVTAHRSLPGRTMLILVRDAAAPNHPVIGIAALGSSVVQQESRDQWIGWTTEAFLKGLEGRSPASVRTWILSKLEALAEGLFVDDLITDGLLTRKDLESPTSAVIERLRVESRQARALHRRNPRASAHKSHQRRVARDWSEAAQTGLFRSKRCEALARYLAIRSALADHLRGRGRDLDLPTILSSSAARTALGQLVRLVKAQHVGIDMMDITVCGAVAPYNHLLGGKLVCLLLTSHEVVEYHGRRYGDQVSVIASSMRGKAVRRPPRLVFLGTTSLYGVGSSQYNRVKVPCQELGGRAGEKLEYKELGLSKGYGSFQFSATTIDIVDTLLGRQAEGRRVNSIFGEGVNPLLRKMREALELLKLSSDRVLNHGNPRVVYGVALGRNFREVLLGFEDKPDYLLPVGDPRRSTDQLAAYWRRRWLAHRATQAEILESVKQHTLAYPVTHGARVPVSALAEHEQLQLHSDLD